jgi:hypothetical protein
MYDVCQRLPAELLSPLLQHTASLLSSASLSHSGNGATRSRVVHRADEPGTSSQIEYRADEPATSSQIEFRAGSENEVRDHSGPCGLAVESACRALFSCAVLRPGMASLVNAAIQV